MHPEKRKEWSVERGKLVQGKSRAKFTWAMPNRSRVSLLRK